ncbi:hypothetical protein RJT34_11196 [Clitoria ternatea]|uniref:SHSP domain-containing protein n=1 Tax=Clitoria ternatea TaxID=43366 RepID=A0AAN9JM18_CLITE
MSSVEKTNVQPQADPVNEDFIPPSDWDHDKESDTLILMLPGFRKEQMRVQVTSNRVLRVSGERKISDNKYRRFRKELPIPETNETSGISAKFEAGMLYVRIPKVSTPIKPQPVTTPTLTQQVLPHKPTPTLTQQEPPHKPTPTLTQQEPPHKPTPTLTQEEPPQKPTPPPPPTTTTTDHKPKVDHDHDHDDHIKATESSKPDEPKILPPHITKEEDFQKEEPEKEKGEEENVANNKTTYAAQETHDDGTTQTLPSLEELDKDHSQEKSHNNKENGKVLESDAIEASNEKAKAKDEAVIASKAHGTSILDGLDKIRQVMKKKLDIVSGLTEDVKKQNQVTKLLALAFLVMFIGLYLYIKSVVKSSFGGSKRQEL